MDSEAFGAAKEKIMSMQRDMIALAMRMSDAFDELEKAVPLKEVKEQLRVECGLTPADIRFFSGLRAKLDGRLSKHARKRLSPSSMRSLATASAETRDIALATIAAGSVVTAKDVANIRARLRLDRMPEAARWEAERARAVAKAATAQALTSVGALDARVTKLMNALLDLDAKSKRIERTARELELSADSKVILQEFDRLFGSDHPGPEEWKNLAEEDPARRLGRTREALVRISNGHFGRGRGWTLDDRKERDCSGLFRALFVLSGHVSRSSMSRPRPRRTDLATRVPRRLTAVELCAGAGGMLIGMHAAGFEHLAAVEVNPKAASTLRRNMPKLHVIEADIRNVDFTPYRGVDVVVGGLPCQPYSILGARRGKDDDRELFLSGSAQFVRCSQGCSPTRTSRALHK